MVDFVTTYVGAPATSHVIPLGSISAGRDVFVAVSAAAGMPAATSPWVREVYGVHVTAGAVYHLPAASNTGSITTLSLTISGARQLAAVVFEDDVDGSLTIASFNSAYTEAATIDLGPFTAASADQHVVVACSAASTGAAQSVSGWSSTWTSLGQTTPTTATDEDATCYVAEDGGRALSSETITATFGASWFKVTEAFLLSYNVSAGPTETPTTLTASSSPASPTNETLVTITATAAESSVTGTVTFTEGATTLGTATMTGSTASLAPRTFTSGSHTVTAALDGTDGVWGDSTDDVTFSVTSAAGDGVVGEQVLVYGDLRAVSSGGSTPYATE